METRRGATGGTTRRPREPEVCPLAARSGEVMSQETAAFPQPANRSSPAPRSANSISSKPLEFIEFFLRSQCVLHSTHETDRVSPSRQEDERNGGRRLHGSQLPYRRDQLPRSSGALSRKEQQ